MVEKIRIGYIIGFVPRSGSTWLSKILSSSGVGNPNEWFHRHFLKDSEIFGSQHLEDHIKWTENNAVKNNIWGCKTTWSQFKVLIDSGKNMNELFNFPLTYFWLDREDRNAQAVSEYKAIGSGKFHEPGTEQVEIMFDLKSVLHVREKLENDRNNFLKWFEENNIKPIRFTYERLCREPIKVPSEISELVRGRKITAISEGISKPLEHNDEWKLILDNYDHDTHK